jgi:ABC-type sugar transport system substrate-binding protein
MAIGAMRSIKLKGLKVPQDISVVGFDDIRFSRYTDPPLTTVAQPKDELGREAMNMLIEVLSGATCLPVREFSPLNWSYAAQPPAAPKKPVPVDSTASTHSSHSMSVKPFHPEPMQFSILTAALQELTPRSVRDADPDRAVEEWLGFARDHWLALHSTVRGAAPD